MGTPHAERCGHAATLGTAHIVWVRVSAAVFEVHVSMRTWLCRSVLSNHVCCHVRDFIGFLCPHLPVCVCVCVCAYVHVQRTEQFS